MSEPLHDIDHLFHNNIEEHTENPPKEVWDKIEAGLDKKTVVIYKKKYEKIKRSLLLLLLLITGILVYEVFIHHTATNDTDGKVRKNTTDSAISVIREKSIDPEPSKNQKEIPASVKNNSSLIQPKKDNSTVHQPQQKNNNSINASNNDRENNVNKLIIPGVTGNKLPAKTGLRTNQRLVTRDENPVQQSVVQKNKGENKAPHDKSESKPVVISNSNSIDQLPGKQPAGLPTAVSPEKTYRLNTPVRQQNNLLASISGLSFISNPVLTATANRLSGAENTLPISPVKPTGKQLAKATKKIVLKKTSAHGLSLSLLVSPAVSWNSLQDDKPHRTGRGGDRIEDHEAIQRSEHNNLSFTGGIKINYALNKNFSIQTGLNYTSTSSSIDPKLIFADRDNNGNVRYRLDCSSGYSFLLPPNGQNPAAGDSLVVSDSRNSLSYTGIPLAIEYKLPVGKFSVSVSAGGQLNLLLKGKTTTVFGKGTTAQTSAAGSTEALKSSYFSALTGITGEFRLNKQFSVTVSPAGQFGLSPINKGASVKTRSNYFGIGAGLKIKF